MLSENSTAIEAIWQHIILNSIW